MKADLSRATVDRVVRDAIKDHYKARRAAVKDKFDTNDDGKLDDSELAALKAAIRARFEKETPDE